MQHFGFFHPSHVIHDYKGLNRSCGYRAGILTTVVGLLVTVALLTGCQNPADESPTIVNSIDNSPTRQNAIASLTENAKYVDDASCADCHQEIYDSYQQVAMAKSFYNFDPDNSIESFSGNKFVHKPSGNHYEISIAGDNIQMTRYRVRDDGSKLGKHTQSAQYVVGSGNHVRSYLYRNDVGEMFQMPVVWYSQQKKWGMAPGYDRPDHSDFSRPITRQCMFCHNAYPDFESGSDEFGKPHLFPERLPQGIGCQRCHGPGSEHVEVASEADAETEDGLKLINSTIVNTAKLSPQLQDDVCNQCHFQPMSQRTSIVRTFGQRDYSYRAGQKLSDYLVHFEPDRNNDLANHFEINHHPYRLHQSRCFISTPGGIRCTDCHDPHSIVPAVRQADYYRAKCFSCHEKNDCLDIENGRQPDSDCISCHMPERRTTDVVNVTMTDHKISRRSRLEKPLAHLREIDVPIDMPVRQLTLGDNQLAKEAKLYELFTRAMDEDESALEPFSTVAQNAAEIPLEPLIQLAQMQLNYRNYEDAERTLNSIGEEYHGLSLYQTNSGISLIGQKEFDNAIERLLRATTSDPKNANAWYNLGVAYSRLDQLDSAANSLRKAIELRPGYSKAITKLGTVQALDEQFEAAIRSFRKAISIDVNNVEAYRKLGATCRRESNFQLAIEALKDAYAFAGSNDSLSRDLALSLLESANIDHRDSKLALEVADHWSITSGSMDAKIVRTLALLDVGKTDEALSYLTRNLEDNDRKPEAGLLLAFGQSKLNSKESALLNYAGARQSLKNTTTDRISSVVLEYVEKYFENSENRNQE